MHCLSIFSPRHLLVWLSDNSKIFVCTASLPGAPTLREPITPTDGALIVAFYPPVDTGGGTISGYVLHLTPSHVEDVSTASSPCTIRGLQNGEIYRVSVAAVNEKGRGPWSDKSKDVIPGT